MRLRQVLPLMFLYSAAVFPQTSNSTNASILATTDQQCPVSVYAKLDQRGVLLSADGKKQRTEGPSLHLIMNNASARQIVSAEVIVHGYPKGRRVESAVVLPHPNEVTMRFPHTDPDEATMRFPLAGPIVPGENAIFYLSLSDLQAVSYIDVVSLKYVGGLIWRPGLRVNCHAFGRTPVDTVTP